MCCNWPHTSTRDDRPSRSVDRYGPADSLIEALGDVLGPLPVIAEELGYMTQEVYKFRERFGFPSMKVLQYVFSRTRLKLALVMSC